MAKKVYWGDSSNLARKLSKGYYGDTSNIARKITKAYIGVGGVARPCWGLGTLSYYGEITPLSVGRYGLAATTIGGHALFAGGFASKPAHYAKVDSYDKSLTRTDATALSKGRARLSVTTIGDYAIFAGGWTSDNTATNASEAYDASLTKVSAPVLETARQYMGATAIGNYAIFAGGSNPASYVNYNIVNAYNSSLTQLTSITALTNKAHSVGATTVGGYAIFAGGTKTESSSSEAMYASVEAYDASLTKTTATSLSVARGGMGALTVGKYAIFAGGKKNRTSYTAVTEAYDASLTMTSCTDLSSARSCFASSTVVDGFALFSVGDSLVNAIDVYDDNLTRLPMIFRYAAIKEDAAATIGSYAIFAGGQSGGYKDRVEACVVM